MADSKISQLTAITTIDNANDVLPIVDTSAGSTKKVSVAQIVTAAGVPTDTDELTEGATNLYFTNARASAAAPVQSVNGSTGAITVQPTLVSGTNIKTINSTSLLGSGDITISGGGSPAGTAGQIQFSDGSAFAADSNLFWDNTNKRLGVGTSSPAYPLDVRGTNQTEAIRFKSQYSSYGYLWTGNSQVGIGSSSFGNGTHLVLSNTGAAISAGGQLIANTGTMLHIKGSGSTSATTALLVQNSSGNQIIMARDDRYVEVGAMGFLTNSTYTTQPFLVGGLIAPVASAIAEFASTTKGFLPPRMTTTQKNAISTPAAGLQLYDSTTSRPCVYTSAWESLTSSDSASPTAVYKFWSGTAAQYAALTPDANTVYFVS